MDFRLFVQDLSLLDIGEGLQKENPIIIAGRLAFIEEGITWSRERLFLQIFSDEV